MQRPPPRSKAFLRDRTGTLTDLPGGHRVASRLRGVAGDHRWLRTVGCSDWSTGHLFPGGSSPRTRHHRRRSGSTRRGWRWPGPCYRPGHDVIPHANEPGARPAARAGGGLSLWLRRGRGPPPGGGAPRVTAADGKADSAARAECRPDGRRAVPAELSVFSRRGRGPRTWICSRGPAANRRDGLPAWAGAPSSTVSRRPPAGASRCASSSTAARAACAPTRSTARSWWRRASRCSSAIPAFAYMHAKVMIVDGTEAFVSTGNYARFGIEQERNFGVHLRDPRRRGRPARPLRVRLEPPAPWLSCTRLLISPINARERLLGPHPFGHPHAAGRHHAVRRPGGARGDHQRHPPASRCACCWPTPTGSPPTPRPARCSGQGIPVRHLPHLHTKVVIVDGRRAPTSAR